MTGTYLAVDKVVVVVVDKAVGWDNQIEEVLAVGSGMADTEAASVG